MNPRTLAAASLAALAAAAQAIDYTVQDLGTLPVRVENDFATGINASGQVSGYVSGNGVTQAFRWTQGTGFEVLGTLGRQPAYGYGINDAGVVVGQSGVSGGGGFDTRPFRSVSGTGVEDLGTLGGAFGEARGVNNAGKVVGGSFNGAVNRAFAWVEGVGMTDLGGFTANGASIAYDVNDADKVVGASTTVGGDTHGFYLGNGTFNDVGVLGGGTLSRALGLNESGVVVGFGGLNGLNTQYGAFRWTQGGGLMELGGLFVYDTRAADVNEGGDVVGSSWIDQNGASRAVIWEGGGSVANLNDLIDPGSGWLLTAASGINDSGQIVGVGQLNGVTRSFLLTPVPEPASMVALGLGALALLRRRRS